MYHKILLRMPKNLHEKLKEEALRIYDKPKTSINSVIVWILEKHFRDNRKDK